MNFEELRLYCLSKPGTTEDLPFNEHTLAFRIESKIYALTNLHEEKPRVNLKCDPEEAQELRMTYSGDVIPGYHMNKKHWNTVYLGGNVPPKVLYYMINNSYELVMASLPASVRKKYQNN